MLPCLHTFCLQCLEKASEVQGAKETLKCPSCDEKVSLPEGGIQSLPVDLRKAHEVEIAGYGRKLETGKEACGVCYRSGSGPAISFCVNCCEFLCHVCEEHHRSARKTQKHEIVTVGTNSDTKEGHGEQALLGKCHQPRKPCPVHDDEKLKFFCELCDKLICCDCMWLEHNDHLSQCYRVEAIAAKAMDALQTQAGECQSIVASLSDSIAQCKTAIQQVESKKREADDVIVKCLNQIRDALLAQCENILLGKVTGLKMQICELEKLHDDVSHVSDMITDALSHAPSQQLSTRKMLSERLSLVLQQYNKTVNVPLQSPVFVTKLAGESVISEVVALGQISGGSDAASSMCDVAFAPCAVVGKEHTVKITTRNTDGELFHHGKETVLAELRQVGSEKGGIQRGKIVNHGDGTYSVSFTPQSTGAHSLQVTIGGHPIRSSPFTITVRPPRTITYDALSLQKTSTYTTYANPWGVACGENGMLAVAECGYHTVSLLSADGRRLHTFGVPGKYSGSVDCFYSPSGVAIIGDEMYVTESSNNRVRKMQISNRSFTTNFGSSGNGDGQFSNPRGICIHPDGRLFIADCNNHRVQVHQPDGTFVSSITGDPQNEESKFRSPWGLAFDPQGLLHIAAHGSMKMYTPEGIYVGSYGNGTLTRPAGIAIDEEGYVIISDNGLLWIYNPDHTQLVKTIEGLLNPMGIACDDSGMFLVAEYGSNRILKY